MNDSQLRRSSGKSSDPVAILAAAFRALSDVS